MLSPGRLSDRTIDAGFGLSKESFAVALLTLFLRFTAVSSLSCYGHHLGHIVSIISAQVMKQKSVYRTEGVCSVEQGCYCLRGQWNLMNIIHYSSQAIALIN